MLQLATTKIIGRVVDYWEPQELGIPKIGLSLALQKSDAFSMYRDATIVIPAPLPKNILSRRQVLIVRSIHSTTIA